MFSSQFCGKWVKVRESNKNLLIETVPYIAIAETVTCIIKIVITAPVYCNQNYTVNRIILSLPAVLQLPTC